MIRKNRAGEPAMTKTSSTDQTTGVVSTACQEGNHASVGEARGGCRSRDRRTSSARMANHLGVGEGQRYRLRPGNAGGGKDPHFGEDCEEGKEW